MAPLGGDCHSRTHRNQPLEQDGEAMTKTELIARQAMRIEEMRIELDDRYRCADAIRNLIYGCSGPLNGNALRYTPEQRAIFQFIVNELGVP